MLENRIALTRDEECDCGSENSCYFVIVHETEQMDDEGVDTFMLHGDEYEKDNTGVNARKTALKKAKRGGSDENYI